MDSSAVHFLANDTIGQTRPDRHHQGKQASFGRHNQFRFPVAGCLKYFLAQPIGIESIECDSSAWALACRIETARMNDIRLPI